MKKINTAWYLFFLHIKLKQKRVTYGKNIRGNRVVISNKGNIVIGDNVSLNSYPSGDIYRTGLITHFADAKITVGDNCNLNGTFIHCNISVTIGNYCMFGPGTKIVDNDSHRVSIDIIERRRSAIRRPVVIEDNVWIGMNCLILKGVKIGTNSIVAANSVITKDVPSNVLVGGNPTRIIKHLIN